MGEAERTTIKNLTDLIHNLEDGNYQLASNGVEGLRITPEEMDTYSFFKDDVYTRNCVSRNEDYELIALCWPVGQVTAIHGHDNQECWVKVVAGTFEEIIYKYDSENNRMVEESKHILQEHNLAHIDDENLFHSLRNISDQKAISLHLYIKPINSCEVYNKKDGNLVVRNLSYFSEKGEILID